MPKDRENRSNIEIMDVADETHSIRQCCIGWRFLPSEVTPWCFESMGR